MSSVFVWLFEVGGVGGAGAAASHLAALDPISLALLAPQVTAAAAKRDALPPAASPPAPFPFTRDTATPTAP